jgi:hypothetical protein
MATTGLDTDQHAADSLPNRVGQLGWDGISNLGALIKV